MKQVMFFCCKIIILQGSWISLKRLKATYFFNILLSNFLFQWWLTKRFQTVRCFKYLYLNWLIESPLRCIQTKKKHLLFFRRLVQNHFFSFHTRVSWSCNVLITFIIFLLNISDWDSPQKEICLTYLLYRIFILLNFPSTFKQLALWERVYWLDNLLYTV